MYVFNPIIQNIECKANTDCFGGASCQDNVCLGKAVFFKNLRSAYSCNKIHSFKVRV